jgi:hypothetical protein
LVCKRTSDSWIFLIMDLLGPDVLTPPETLNPKRPDSTEFCFSDTPQLQYSRYCSNSCPRFFPHVGQAYWFLYISQIKVFSIFF